MDIFFSDPSEIPLPREEVRILSLKADLYPEGKRIRIVIELTPFLDKPSGDIVVLDGCGHHLAEASFIEAIVPKFEMTLHLRNGLSVSGGNTVVTTVFYHEDIDDEGQDDQEPRLPAKMVVDEAEASF